MRHQHCARPGGAPRSRSDRRAFPSAGYRADYRSESRSTGDFGRILPVSDGPRFS